MLWYTTLKSFNYILMKTKLLALLALGAVAVAAITYYAMNREEDQTVSNSSENAPISQPAQNETNPLFSSIRDAMNRGLSLECTFTDQDGQTSISYVKGKNVYTTLKNPSDKNSPDNFLLLDQSLYFWQTGSKDGLMVTVDASTSQKVQEQTKGAEDVDKAINTDILGAIDRYKSNCKEATVSDSVFKKPTGVTFQNFSELYKSK
jgi:hypothetical protein